MIDSVKALNKTEDITKPNLNSTEDPPNSLEFGTTNYYLLCGAGGVLSCGLSHLAITPFDVVKCRLQTDSEKYKNVRGAIKVTLVEEGLRGLMRGWVPTLIGYSIQGFLKYSLYEWFTVYYAKLADKKLYDEYPISIILLSSASAEIIADIGLSPFEIAKVKMQTCPPFSSTMIIALRTVIKSRGYHGFYSGLLPLWLRQLPYTMLKFTCLEKSIDLLHKLINWNVRKEYSQYEYLMLSYLSGITTGAICAIISHPADSIITEFAQRKHPTFSRAIEKLGWVGLWRGLGPRTFMIGTLTGLQWSIYEGFAMLVNLPHYPSKNDH